MLEDTNSLDSAQILFLFEIYVDEGLNDINQSKCLFRIIQWSLFHVQCSNEYISIFDDDDANIHRKIRATKLEVNA